MEKAFFSIFYIIVFLVMVWYTRRAGGEYKILCIKYGIDFQKGRIRKKLHAVVTDEEANRLKTVDVKQGKALFWGFLAIIVVTVGYQFFR